MQLYKHGHSAGIDGDFWGLSSWGVISEMYDFIRFILWFLIEWCFLDVGVFSFYYI